MREAAIELEELKRRLEAEFPETFNSQAGLIILEIWNRGCRVRQDFLKDSLRPGGTISGTTMMQLADVSAYVAVLASIGWTPLAVTTSLSTSML
jgi:acyl-coenzyme A thioesterase PaaI-like protein